MSDIKTHLEEAGDAMMVVFGGAEETIWGIAEELEARAERLARTIWDESQKGAANIGKIGVWTAIQAEFEKLAVEIRTIHVVNHVHTQAEFAAADEVVVEEPPAGTPASPAKKPKLSKKAAK